MKDIIYLTVIFIFICTVSVFLSWVTPIGYWSYVFTLTITWYAIETIKKHLLNR